MNTIFCNISIKMIRYVKDGMGMKKDIKGWMPSHAMPRIDYDNSNFT